MQCPFPDLTTPLNHISGLSGNQFLSSIEQFDKSSASWNVPLQRDWRIINNALNSPRYEMAVASIPATKLTVSWDVPFRRIRG
jgi:hypothetical protein